jgi:hypothetical protein
MSVNYNGEPTPAGTVGTPSQPTPGPGHTNNGQDLGNRRSSETLQKHFDGPNLDSNNISVLYWAQFIHETKRRYSQAPDLLSVPLKHSMHPNTTIPAEGDDLDDISPGETYSTSHVMTPNVNWPLQGPTPSKLGPDGDQNPFRSSVDVTRINYIFMEGRKTRWA